MPTNTLRPPRFFKRKPMMQPRTSWQRKRYYRKMHDRTADAAKRIWDLGADLAGSVGGAAFGLAFAGAPGALAGAVAAPVLAGVLDEVAGRVLSRREQVRVGAVVRYAADSLQQMLDAGAELRTDDFFATGPAPAAGEEVIEGVLLASQREPQERKLEFMGHLIASVAVNEDITAQVATWATKVAEELTWMQVILLSLVGEKGTRPLPAIRMDAGHPGEWDTWGLMEQLADLGLGRRELVVPGRMETPRMRLPTIDPNLANYRLSTGGYLLHKAMRLDQIDESETLQVRDALWAVLKWQQKDGGAKNGNAES